MTASTYTPIGLIQPGVGDPATRNAWGALLNTDMTLIDSIVNGVVTIAVGGGAGTTVLTFTPGAADQVKNTHFVFTGVLTGNRIILWPQSVTASFSVQNNTTGAFTLTIGANDGASAPAGTTQAVTQGNAGFYISNGTNINVRVTSSTAANISSNTIVSNVTASPAAGIGNTLTQVLDAVASNARGATLVRTNTAWTALAPGTAKQFLQTGGAGADVAWANGAVILESGSLATGTTEVLAKSLASYAAGFSRIEVDIDNLILSASAEIRLTVSTDAGSSYLSANYAYTTARLSSSYTGSTGSAAAYVAVTGGFAGGAEYQARLNFYGLTGSGAPLMADGSLSALSGTSLTMFNFAATNTSTSVNAFKLVVVGATVTSGKYRIIGYV